MTSRNKREGEYLAGTIIGFVPKINPATGHYGGPNSKRPNVRAGAGMKAAYTKTLGRTYVRSVAVRW